MDPDVIDGHLSWEESNVGPFSLEKFTSSKNFLKHNSEYCP